MRKQLITRKPALMSWFYGLVYGVIISNMICLSSAAHNDLFAAFSKRVNYMFLLL
jgi:hypothetical protein